MTGIEEAIKQAKIKNRSPLEKSGGIYFDEALAEVQGKEWTNPEQNTAWLNNPLADTAGAFGVGMGEMMNDTLVGGAGYILSNLGRGVEYISPFSGRSSFSDDTVNALLEAGYTPEQIKDRAPYEDSWLTSAAKGTLGVREALRQDLGDIRTYMLGEDPSVAARLVEGSGTSIGHIIAGMVMGATPLIGALIAGAGEALSEAGGFMGDAYEQGQYDKALGVANALFLTNLAANAGLDYGLGWFSPYVDNIVNPYKKWLLAGLGEVANEVLQEPTQHVIEAAAQRAIDKGTGFTGFFPELADTSKDWWDTAKELAPEVAGSTILTQLLLGAGGLATRRGDIDAQYRLSKDYAKYSDINSYLTDVKKQTQAENADPLHVYGTLQGKVNDIYSNIGADINTSPEVVGQLQDILWKVMGKEDLARIDKILEGRYALGNEFAKFDIYNNLIRERDKLNEQANDIYLNYGNDTEPNEEAANTLHNIISQIMGLNVAIDNYWHDTGVTANPVLREKKDLFPDSEELNTPSTPPTPSEPPAPPTSPAETENISSGGEGTDMLRDLIQGAIRGLLPDEQQTTTTQGVQTTQTQTTDSLPSLTSLGKQDNNVIQDTDTFDDVQDEPDSLLDNAANADNTDSEVFYQHGYEEEESYTQSDIKERLNLTAKKKL